MMRTLTSDGKHGSINVNSKLLDRQELKYIACEYAKLIVSKANELSQTKKSQRTAIQTNHRIPTINHDLNGPNVDNETGILIHEAAKEITSKLSTYPVLSNVIRIDNNSLFTSNGVNHPSLITKVQEQSDDTSSQKNGTSTISRDYNEQDYATISSSQEDTDCRKNFDHSSRRAFKGRSRFKGIHQRINWHLLVSCFSSCLPDTLVHASRSTNRQSSVSSTGV